MTVCNPRPFFTVHQLAGIALKGNAYFSFLNLYILNNLINRVSATITETEISEVKGLFDQIEMRMPFLIGLTADERVTMPKISDANKIFVQNCINAMVNNAELLPSYLNVDDLAKDLELFGQLEEMELLAMQLSEKIRDTRMLAGSEAYVSSLSAYRFFEAAALAGVAGADTVYDMLKKRFTGQGKTVNNTAASPEPLKTM